MTLNSQKKSLTPNFSAIKWSSSEYLFPPKIKLVLLNGPKFIAWTLFSLASSSAKFNAVKTLSPDSFEHSDKLYL